MRIQHLKRRVALAAAVAIAAGVAGCSDFLQVENPGAVEEKNVDNPAYLQLLVNGVIGEFQPAFTSTALYSGVLSDELSNWHGFAENIEIDNRSLSAGNGTAPLGVYTPLQSARFLADSAMSFTKKFLGDTAIRDVRLARVADYAGYSYVMLGEVMCSAPIGLTRAYTSEELLGIALDRFKTAIDVANAAKTYNTTLGATGAKNVLIADSLLNLARVGAARASLDLGKTADAIAFAGAVPTTFAFRVYHSANSARENNPFFAAASGGANAAWVGVQYTPFENLKTDPRIPRPATIEKVQQLSTFVPNAPPAFSNYNATLTGADFTRDASVIFASGLEAQYIIAEAQGSNAANLAFINTRRAVGGDAPLVSPTDADFKAAVRDQRSRDLYLAGFRLGDLRRYKKLYSLDLWQHGTYNSPVPAPPTFGTAECFPIPLAEYNGNPNLNKP
jgi:hypothetical protein